MVRVSNAAAVGDSVGSPTSGFGAGVVPASLVGDSSLKHVNKMEAATNRVEAKKATRLQSSMAHRGRDTSEMRKRNSATSSRPLLGAGLESEEDDDESMELSGDNDDDAPRCLHSEDMLAHEADFEAPGGVNMPFVYVPSTRSRSREKRRSAEDGGLKPPAERRRLKKLYKEWQSQHVLLRPFVWIQRMKDTLKDDFGSIALLLFLYLLQGIPLGLISAIPLILQSKEITYAQQAVFSFAHWPFSMKLLWAPIVDSLFFKKLGRRKSWMVPTQYLIGMFLLVVSYYVPEILGTNKGDGEKTAPNVYLLMSVFLPLNFLAATQDIAVDGWALTMLSRKNVGYASTCNVVGQTVGFFMGNVVFLTLQSKDFANKWLRSVPAETGLVEFDGFVFFWGWVFLITTTLVLIFKHEIDHSVETSVDTNVKKEIDSNEELTLGVWETYSVLVRIICLRPMRVMVLVLLTAKIAFAAADSMTDLKLIAAGITTDKIASRSIFLTPLQIILPWLLGKQTAGPKPLNVFLWAYPYRLFMGIVFAALVYFTPSFREENGEYPYVYYIVWIGVYYLQQVSSYCIFLSMMAFNAQISDPKIGGTYMTLLNTLNNLGGNWPATLVLSVTDFFNRKNCVSVATRTVLATCNTKADEELCKAGGDKCEFVIDGYYISAGICTIIGLIWFKVFYSRIQWFQKIPRTEWRVIKTGKW